MSATVGKARPQEALGRMLEGEQRSRENQDEGRPHGGLEGGGGQELGRRPGRFCSPAGSEMRGKYKVDGA